MEVLKDVKALTFDVFGTVVDWRSTVHAELIKRARDKIASPAFNGLPEPLQSRLKGISDEDWDTFAQEWRTSYGEFTWSFVPGKTEWKDIDTHHYDSLKELLDKWGIAGVYTEAEIRSLSRTWHYLRPWDDSALGIQKLGTRYVTATLSNGNRSLLEDLDKYGSLGFKRIISTADFGAYKVRLLLRIPPCPPSLRSMTDRPAASSRILPHIGAQLTPSTACPMRWQWLPRTLEI